MAEGPLWPTDVEQGTKAYVVVVTVMVSVVGTPPGG